MNANSIPNNLPLQLTSFIGRTKAIEEIKRLLSTTRLLTLTGAGGCGKTRLAIKVAEDLHDAFSDGAWFVDLAPLSDSALVPQTVAAVVDLQSGTTSPTELLKSYFRTKNLLLILDNCEHLIQACAELSDTLLHASPGLKILATSREALNIAGEITFRVPSLSLPDPQQLPPPESLAQSESIRLFIERARAVQSNFVLTDANAPAIAQICHRLDGIPLAIELAAARIKALSVEEISSRLNDRFQLLKSGSRTAVPRQQTLRAAIDWSYDLLSEPERILFRRLAVFAGGWTLKATEEICAGKGIESREIVDVLSHLVDKSLVILSEQSELTRYRMLETIRQYAREKLDESGELEKVQNCHLEFFLHLAEEAEPNLEGAEQVSWLNRLEREHDNFRSALGYALEKIQEPDQSRVGAGLQLAGALSWFWFKHSHWSEGRQWLEEALAKGIEVSAPKRAKALLGTGLLVTFQGDLQLGASLIGKSLTLYKKDNDHRGIADSLLWLGLVTGQEGDFARAATLTEASLNLYKQIENKPGIAFALDRLGELACYQGDWDNATRFLEESVVLSRESGNKWLMAISLKYLSLIALNRGDTARATTLAGEGLAMNRELADKRQIGSSLYFLALATQSQGDIVAARGLLADALALLQEMQDKDYTASCLEALAGIAVAEGAYEQAARVFGAAEALRQAINMRIVLFMRGDFERNVVAVRAKLDQVTFEKLWAEGRTMSLAQAIEYALKQTISDAAAQMQPVAYPAGLTAREAEVLRLLARGLSNQQIADKLVLSKRTVEAHLRSIFSKLDVTTRSAATRAAIEIKLV